jgi:polyhydroxyalkanoate synthesis repressor PhaR
MHHIKKYANRKLYDETTKQYVTMDEIAELVQTGEDVQITDNTNGQDITQKIVSQLVGRVFDGQASTLPASVLMQLLRRGSGGILDYTRKYLSLWQNALNFAEDELDKVDSLIGRDKSTATGKKPSPKDKNRGADDRNNRLKPKLDESSDQRPGSPSSAKEVELKKRISRLTSDVVKLQARLEAFEKNFSQKVEMSGETASKTVRNKKKAGTHR